MIIVKTKQQQKLLKKYGYKPNKRLQSIKIYNKCPKLRFNRLNYTRVWIYTKKDIKDDPLVVEGKFKNPRG